MWIRLLLRTLESSLRRRDDVGRELSRERSEEKKKHQRSKFFPVPLDSEILAEVGFRISAQKHKSNMKIFESESFQRIF
jgi:hypothetical protein